MKHLAFFLLAASMSATAADDNVLGHYRVNDSEVEVYNQQAWCEKYEGMAASIYPSGKRQEYAMGCWKPLFTDQILVNFRDGRQMIFYRSQLVRPGQESKVTL